MNDALPFDQRILRAEGQNPGGTGKTRMALRKLRFIRVT
jgi:hypothetical protein